MKNEPFYGLTPTRIPRSRNLENERQVIFNGAPGRVEIVLEGELCKDACNHWTFNGRVRALPDRFDFDPDRDLPELFNPAPDERGPGGEFVTHVMDSIEELLPSGGVIHAVSMDTGAPAKNNAPVKQFLGFPCGQVKQLFVGNGPKPWMIRFQTWV